MANDWAGERIAEMRKAKGWSQAHLAEVAGVSERTVGRAETGVASLETMQALASVLGTEVKEFVRPKQDSPGSPSGTELDASTALVRLVNGRGIATLIDGAFAYQFDHDEVQGDDAELVGGFLQLAKDWGELWSDLEPAERVRAASGMGDSVKELEARGFWVFGAREKRTINFANGTSDVWPVAILAVYRKDNPAIVQLDLTDDGAEKIS